MSRRIPSPFRLVLGLILRDVIVGALGFSPKKGESNVADIMFAPIDGL